jgi:DNA ligase (NAD+)
VFIIFSAQKTQHTKDGNLTGQTFLFTGTLPTLKRSEAEAMAEANGGQILGGVSAKLNYLVVGEDAGSKLDKAKKLNTVKIISEDEFLKLVGKK